MSRAQRFLALLQRHAHRDVDPAVYAATAASLTAKLREDFRRRGYPMDVIDRAIKEFGIDPNNTHVHPADNTIIPRILEELEAGARFTGTTQALLPTERPVFGTLPSGEVNAMTIKVPGTDEFVIVLESQLMLFANMVAKAVAPAFVITERGLDLNADRLRQRLAPNREVARRFTEVVMAYAQYGQPSRAPIRPPDEQHTMFISMLVHGMERFVVAHELGHVVKDHLADASSHERHVVADQDVESVNHSWKQEIEADQHGLLLSILAATGEGGLGSGSWGLLFGSGGADLFFSAMDVMDRATSLLRTGNEHKLTLGSHPPASQRRAVLRECIRLLMRQVTSDDDAVEPLVRFSQCLELAVDLLWQQAQPHITQAHAAGVRPGPAWRQVEASQQ